jgi:hypothetical protein
MIPSPRESQLLREIELLNRKYLAMREANDDEIRTYHEQIEEWR